MDEEKSYWRADVQRFINVDCKPEWKPFLCFHNNRIDEDCQECRIQKAAESK